VKIERTFQGDPETWPAETCVLDLIDRRGHMTLEEIATLLGMTRERVRQVEAKALRKLRNRAGHYLEEFSDENQRERLSTVSAACCRG